ncbi:pentapeptide repeat-containing protein [Lyngbya sp. PCC 8106]|uniref:pentapeptide repeat-containing protein n=1 Tax=Lyngbya sp. (strain PCC 8106) TaxID=313612 RepID=UPI0000EA9BDE|nr:pentapeptide repeat-containing protein [Lyngbya sp. PCC 8106]EAW37366.1 Pentapeptide repeat protein [Lyngbya sp. PCC 8106]
MTSPTASRDVSPSNPSWQIQVRQLPLWVRRCGAWAVEVSLVVASGAVPYGIGALCNRTSDVPLSPVLRTTGQVIGATLGLPVRDRNPQVNPLTNLFWWGALLTPTLVGGWQVYLLATRGQTLPKRWFAVQVIQTNSVAPPGLLRAFYRESVGRWGIPVGIAYIIWRVTGAFPNLIILTGLSGLMILADGLIARRFQGRTGHDLWAGTRVREVQLPTNNPFTSYDWSSEQEAVRAIVFRSKQGKIALNLWAWMRQHPGITLLTVSGASMAAVLGTFVGTQVYIQNQANRREFQHQDNEVFLALVSKLSPSASTDPAQRRGAILALGTLNDSRAIPLLVDYLGQESNPLLLDSAQQALVSTGPIALPYLRQLNQALKNDLDSMQFGANAQDKQLVEQRQQATQRAIAKILTVHEGNIHHVDLSRVDLGQSTTSPTQFTLILDQIDLSGFNFRSSILSHASFKNSSFYGPGEDGRYETFDDWVSDLSGADLTGSNFTGAFLSHINMRRANLLRATLNKADLSQADLTGANFSSAKLIGANLEQAKLNNAKFTGTDLANANLSEANLKNARLNEMNAQGALFIEADLENSQLQNADLSGADLKGADLRNTDLSSALLTGANFRNANLKNANLQNADLTLVSLRGANLRGVDFQDAVFFVNQPEDNNQDSIIEPLAIDTQSNRMRGVNFSRSKNLSSEQISYLCNQGAIHPDCKQ